jgi:hypothetical protein
MYVCIYYNITLCISDVLTYARLKIVNNNILFDTINHSDTINNKRVNIHYCIVFYVTIFVQGHINRVCQSCWLRGNRRLLHDQQRIPLPPQLPEENLPFVAPAFEDRENTAKIVLPNYSRAPNTSRHCIYNACRNVARHLVPTFIKVLLVKEHKYYVPRSARVCEIHLNSNDWQRLPEINTQRISEFTDAHVEDMIDLAKRDMSFNFENVNEMPNHVCHYWTGLTVLEFTALYDELMIENYITSPKTSLAMYLMKLRTGDSGKRLCSLFQIPRTTLELRIKKVREYLVEHFIPLHLGLQHMTPQDVATRNLMVPNALFGQPDSGLEERPAITICDGTYIYIEKSSNYLYHKKLKVYTNMTIL